MLEYCQMEFRTKVKLYPGVTGYEEAFQTSQRQKLFVQVAGFAFTKHKQFVIIYMYQIHTSIV
jgi:hypothetical protein